VPHSPEGPFLGEPEGPVSTVLAEEAADVLDDPGLLVIGLLDEEAVVLDGGRLREENVKREK
jgi:hypothetical protein